MTDVTPGREDRARDKAARQAAARDAARSRSDALTAIEELVPQVLAAVKAKGFPDATTVRIQGVFTIKYVRAWVVATREVPWGKGTDVSHCYLLADGRFNFGGDNNPAMRPSQIVPVSAEEIAVGLEELLRRYG